MTNNQEIEKEFDKVFYLGKDGHIIKNNSNPMFLPEIATLEDIKAWIKERDSRLVARVEAKINKCNCLEKGQRVCSCGEYEAGKEAGMRLAISLIKENE